MATSVKLTELERFEKIAQDSKKVFVYDKHTGKWAWCDRGEEDNLEAHNGEFATRYDALADAVEPYL